ncbi:cyclic nucleotide-binding domain-containing protein [Desulfonatronovibrio hydrogenovorans]|uniref:cyclic nucleotide-binding domain-containing protein n=1 Tax=Desulfonatronovibrio hydrogenovorans TaxID=53245 RepID=UPI0004911E0A|nr:cyclic nucleotide-binding domain-containing protein [Desulfonatronovibrio hydrogenovorans]
MNPDQLQAPLDSTVVMEEGRELLVQDRLADCLYLILSGRIDLFRDRDKVLQLGPGSVVGAEPLFCRSRSYTYSAVCVGTVRASRYYYSQILDQLGLAPEPVRGILDSLGHQLDFFWTAGRDSDLSREHFLGQIRTYDPGQWIIREGNIDTDIYRIVSTDGGLEVSKDGRELARLDAPGEFFGEMAWILGEKRTASVRALGRTVLEVHPGEQLESIVSQYPQLAMRIITALSGRLARTSRELAGDRGDFVEG